MAKNKIKKDNKTKDLFNSTIREFSKKLVKNFLTKTENNRDSNLEFLMFCKKYILESDELWNVSDCSKQVSLTILDAINDLCLVSTENNDSFNRIFDQIRELTISKITKETSPYQVIAIIQLACAGKVMGNENIESVDLKKAANSTHISLIMISYSILIMSYFIKFKNNKILTIKYDGVNEKVAFSGKTLITDHALMLLSKGIKTDFNSSFEEGLTFCESLTQPIVQAYERKKVDIFDNNYTFERVVFKEGFLPSTLFSNDNKTLIFDEQELANTFENRHYGILPNGARFDFIDKSCGIDYIDIKENERIVSLRIVFSDSKNILVLEPENFDLWLKKSSNNNSTQKLSAREFATPIKEEFILALELNKTLVKDNLSELNDMTDLFSIPHLINIPNLVIDFSEDLTTNLKLYNLLCTIMCCIHIAFCNPNYKQSFVRMYNIEQSNGRRFVNRKSAFRIAHLRKLPIGYECSDLAKTKAKAFGFTNIPNGYTFVGEKSISNNTSEPKIFKI